MLDLAAMAAARTEHEPFDYLVVPHFLRPEAMAAVIRDYPDTHGPRNHEVQGLRYGPAFARLLEELQSPELARLLGEKLAVPGLPDDSTTVTVRGACEPSDGHIHTDHWSKQVTLLVYPNEGWTAEGGRLRMLRSARDLEDFAAEVEPAQGTMLAFRRSRHSFHGHRPYEGPRRMVQVNWIRPSRLARVLQQLSRRGTHDLKRLGLHPSRQ